MKLGKKINNKTVVLVVKTNLDTALGSSYRDEYLLKNPHGFSKVTKIHKSKKTYKRNNKIFL